jgi:hypothetical protein
MRFVLTLASLLTVGLLVFNNLQNVTTTDDDSVAGNKTFTPVSKAKNVNLVIEDTASLKRQELEKQLQ